ncbi:hypothetical protein [Streptomyces sp. NPDC048639]|uniref:hypothetical protein n=1 Tax=Streptomyces sp. NPDC048639 TaxID=3365581 RepID=UPI0037171ED9
MKAPAEVEQVAAVEEPELLPLAEISRRLAVEGIEVKPELMRQHKRRRTDFPTGTTVDGRELWTYKAVATYYAPPTSE